jgi:hypothetical protein
MFCRLIPTHGFAAPEGQQRLLTFEDSMRSGQNNAAGWEPSSRLLGACDEDYSVNLADNPATPALRVCRRSQRVS